MTASQRAPQPTITTKEWRDTFREARSRENKVLKKILANCPKPATLPKS